VIVILGILAAFALPRFADLGGEARAAALQGAYGAMRSASSIAHADYLVQGDNSLTEITMEGQVIQMLNGYPEAQTAGSEGILDAAQITAADFDLGGTPGGLATSTVTVTASGVTPANAATCRITYTAATANNSPTISIDVTNCD
ncbi:type II secretion system protein, partial [Oleiphilus sp. HI0086]